MATLFAADPALEKTLADIEQKAGTVKTCQAEVATSFTMMNQAMSGQGTIAFSQPNKYRMDMDIDMGGMKMKQMMVSDGKTLWMHQPMMNMVTKIDLAKAGAAESPQMQNMTSGNLSKPFQGVRRESITALGAEVIEGVETQGFEAVPDMAGAAQTPFMPVKVRVWIGTADGMVRKVSMLDKEGAEQMSQTYRNVKLNVEIPDSQFEFTPPEGAQVMDMTAGAANMMKGAGGQGGQ